MLADRRTGELHHVAFAGNLDQREIAGAAADVADQNGLAIEESFLRLGEVIGDPGLESRGGFFEQSQIYEAGLLGGFDSEFAGFFVERGGNRQNDVLFG